ncbi:MAG: FAD-dependent oxidoreductase [Acidimicrobiales bacterium]
MVGDTQVLIVGAGLAGLSCAVVLDGLSIPYQIVDASDRPGGKLRTDAMDGYLIDRGFHVVLPDYPEARRFFTERDLELQYFTRGLLVDDVMGTPSLLSVEDIGAIIEAVRGTVNPIDAAMALRNLGRALPQILRAGNAGRLSMADVLALLPRGMRARYGVLEPLLRGITCAPDLSVPARFGLEVLTAMIRGGVGVPSTGIERLPIVLANRLRQGVTRGVSVSRVDSHGAVLEDGSRINADITVVATDATSAERLLGGFRAPEYHRVNFAYFESESPLLSARAVYVPSVRHSSILTVADISHIAPAYARTGKNLVSVSYQENERVSLEDFTTEVIRVTGTNQRLELVAHGSIEHALPVIDVGRASRPDRSVFAKNIYLAGDYLEEPSINGALCSGRRAARAIARQVTSSGMLTDPVPK